MPVRNIFQQILSSTIAVCLLRRDPRRLSFIVIPTTAVNVWIGATENVTKTNGFLCNQTIPFPSGSIEVDATQEIWCISDSATPTVAVYEDRLAQLEAPLLQ